jgi:hypothetical protein
MTRLPGRASALVEGMQLCDHPGLDPAFSPDAIRFIAVG